MTTISAEEVAAVAAVGTPPGTTVAQWVAKARQESGFRTDIQDFLGSGHWGLWQIDEDHYGKPGLPGASSKSAFITGLKTPGFNWMAAKALYAQSGWAPWRATGGKPTPTPADIAAAGKPDSSILADEGTPLDFIPGVGDVIPDPLQAFQTLIEPALAAAKWVGDPSNWIRIVQVGAGIVIGVVALNLAFRPIVDKAIEPVKDIL